MNDLTPAELHQLLSNGEKLFLVDVREPHEHEEFNLGGVNIPVTSLPFRIEDLKDAQDDKIVLYCQSGNRSGMAQKLLATQFKIEDTFNLKGGVNGWKETFPS